MDVELIRALVTMICVEWGGRRGGGSSAAGVLTRVAMTLEDNSSGWLLCGRVHAVASLMNNVKTLLLQHIH